MAKLIASVPMLVADPAVCAARRLPHFEDVDLDGDFFLDGPVTRRVAVLDFDEKTGDLHPGIPFVPPREGGREGRYQPDSTDPSSRQMQALGVFATVMKTILQFEDPEVLGREVRWAFDAPQLLIVPRAGELVNAFYQRESHSLQFFFFNDDEDRRVYTAASRDIVAHETAHALLDGIAPDLHHASTPQSLALHECVADMVALLSAFSSRTLSDGVLEETGGSISASTAFSELAEQFGGKRALRSLRNEKRLCDVPGTEPHRLSEVLSGALYAVVEALFNARKAMPPRRLLGGMTSQFRRILVRALDYLPPGEISFADYGRAIMASDQAAYPKDPMARETLSAELVKRGIVPKAAALAVKTNFKSRELAGVDLDTLVDSDWAAYEFANRNRAFLRIPRGIHFRVHPRLRALRSYRQKPGEDPQQVHEYLFKVSWDQTEPNRIGGRFAPKRQITVGTTLAVNAQTREVRALLTADHEQQAEWRDALLRTLAARHLLAIDAESEWMPGKPLGSTIRVEQMKGVMRVRGTARMLHVGRI
ncbi:MAG TPA: hypothetical protein VF432_06785 [Thermoanaerobaculia bacterium]